MLRPVVAAVADACHFEKFSGGLAQGGRQVWCGWCEVMWNTVKKLTCGYQSCIDKRVAAVHYQTGDQPFIESEWSAMH